MYIRIVTVFWETVLVAVGLATLGSVAAATARRTMRRLPK